MKKLTTIILTEEDKRLGNNGIIHIHEFNMSTKDIRESGLIIYQPKDGPMTVLKNRYGPNGEKVNNVKGDILYKMS